MAAQIDLDQKPTLSEWLASDPWLDGLLRGVLAEYRQAHKDAYDETMLRFGAASGPAGPQVRSA